MQKPVVLAILDGWGFSRQSLGNAIADAKTPNLDAIQMKYPLVLLQASGKSAGLSWGETGNSEVGHLTMGAGRVIFQYLSRINRAIENGEFYQNTALLEAINHAKKNQSSLHIVGLLTANSVHAYFGHAVALLKLAKTNQLTKVYLHLFSDGKDSGLKEAPVLINALKVEIEKTGIGVIATLIGRDFAMDRDNNWNLIQKTYDLEVNAVGEAVTDITSKLNEFYAQGLDDTRIPPLVLDAEGKIQDNDAVIFFNFREDSMRQITKAFVEYNFQGFERTKLENIFVSSMTKYFEDKNLHIAFEPPQLINGLAETISNNGLKQLHVAETEKYAHVTYFFNGLKEGPFKDEDDMLIQSIKNPAENPAMKAVEIGVNVIDEIDRGYYDFIVINIANADVLAHEGRLDSAILGIEVIDQVIGKLKDKVLEKGGALLITSDHGNAESIIYTVSGEIETKHNQNPVPLYLISKEYERTRSFEEINRNTKNAIALLADVAPTVLELLGLPKPAEMTGESLLSLMNSDLPQSHN